jgi:adenosylcobinamide-GDP ribazoletransferase
MKNVISSLSFTSRIPLGNLVRGKPDFTLAAIHFPLAGYLSFVLFGCIYLSLKTVFHDEVIARMIAMAGVYFYFNLFHFDGFMDSVDGLFSQKPKDKMLEIMRSGTAGPMGVAAALFYLALKLYLVIKLNVFYLLAAFVLARWGMVFSAAIGKPARPDGLGALILPLPGRSLALASLYLLPLLIVFKIPLMLPVCAVLLCDAAIVRAVTGKIDGLTGDSFGMIAEANEIVVLLVCATGWI